MTTTDDIAVRLAGLTTDPAGEGPEGPDTVADLVAQALARADADGLVDVAWAVDDTPIGPLTLAATTSGVVKIAFGADESALAELAATVSPRLVRLPRRLDALRRELDEYFAGRRRDFDVGLDRRLSHGYRLAVLEELSRVRFGETVTYKDLAQRTGHPKASRAVGTAMATNPIPIVVPCHRVLRTGGALGGYGGGLDTKAWLLRHEGALLS
ncbi:MAG TPA: methylated-DNA--[protein]-cysteine S-methyltransferase [Acidimicrobiales bacterium]|jgi:methylated-DNA-[protein]-cysteine S-methyltransferase|nr:methylated-DNA--[protein]-cysteine S-methyltransferase [Acidimicrobiales bacterium]